MALSQPEPEHRTNTLSTTVGGGCKIDKAAPLDNFNSAYDSIRQVRDRLTSLMLVVKGEDSDPQEVFTGCHCMRDLLANMPDNIRNECAGINDQITEIEQILFT